MDGDHLSHDGVCADRRVTRTLGVAPQLEHTSRAAGRDTDDAMCEQTRAMTAQQHVAGDDVVGGDGGDRNRFAVSDCGIHAGTLGAEPCEASVREGEVDHRGKHV